MAVGQYADISLATWMASTPHELVTAHLKLDVDMLEKSSQQMVPA